MIFFTLYCNILLTITKFSHLWLHLHKTYASRKQHTAPDYNMLRAVYRDGADSHPNKVGNEAIGPIFADFIMKAAQNYRDIYASSQD